MWFRNELSSLAEVSLYKYECIAKYTQKEKYLANVIIDLKETLLIILLEF